MKILSASQIREADAWTIAHEPVSSLDLMERAAKVCLRFLKNYLPAGASVKLFCSTGNNGGDGIALARLLNDSGIYNADAFIVRHSSNSFPDFIMNEERLKQTHPSALHEITATSECPPLKEDEYVIDALFGTGLSRQVQGLAGDVITYINQSNARVIAIDMPSGLFADSHTEGNGIIHASITLSFQLPKLSFLFAENELYVGKWHLLNIGLDKNFIHDINTRKHYITSDMLHFLRHRTTFSHKGSYGRALLMAGGYGKMGAAILAVDACIRTGAGLTIVHIPGCGYHIMQTSVPEAMTIPSESENNITGNLIYDSYQSIGVGPGIGTEEEVTRAVKNLLASFRKPIVIDADALNILAANKEWLTLLPAGSIITPHLKEFERLAGTAKNDFERHEQQLDFSSRYNLYIILKGAHTCITTPQGDAYFNSTGNPGMAKGGSGDVLTGMLTALLAQGYSPIEAAMLGVYLHGLAGDIAASKTGMESMIARDIINNIPDAFQNLKASL